MLTPVRRAGVPAVLFLAALLLGTLLGTLAPGVADAVSGLVDPLILALVGVLFFTLRFDGLSALRRAPRTALAAVGTNFLVIPVIALGLTALLPSEALRVGVLIYCLAPCTDWFLGFTRLAGGDTAVGAALIPVQMLLQLALYPVWLFLFAGRSVDAVPAVAGPALLTWFVLPAAAGLGLRLLLHVAVPAAGRRLAAVADRAVPFVIAVLIVAIFAGNVAIVFADLGSFCGVLLVVFLFFVTTFSAGSGIARLFRLTRPESALLTMTTSARNAPLMLAVTVVALPHEAVVHAAIILGMLIEFPHLTLITHLLRRRPLAEERGLVLSR